LFTDDFGDLYIAVGSNTNAGHPSGLMGSGQQKENYFSGAVLVAHLSTPGFNGVITYNAVDDGSPVGGFGPNGVEVFAAGVRNSFGLFYHSNGNLYATDNGPNQPYGRISTGCSTSDSATGVTEGDKLLLLKKGGFYGHANRKRGATDPRQCIWRSSTGPSTSEFTAPLLLLKSSTCGIIEFESDHFDGQMRGDLILSKYNSELFRVILTNNGQSVSPLSDPAVSLTGSGGLAVTQVPDGSLIDARHTYGELYVHKPVEVPSTALDIKSVFPRRGRLSGNSKLMIFGVNFAGGGLTVTVGGSPCLNAVLVTSKKIECTLPSGTAGRKDVVVTIGGMSDTFVKGYRYITGVPP
jgi:IPT/TIG domain/Glucose / Sorbosone dehydrogenase